MKNQTFKKMGAIICLVTMALMILELASPPKSEAQSPVGMGQRSNFAAITNMPSIVLANMSTNLNTGVIPLRKGQGIAIMPLFAFTNGNAGTNIQINFVGSPDGTNWTHNPVFSMTVPGNGTSLALGYTNVPPSWLDNISWLRVSTITNQNVSSLFLTNIIYSFLN